MLVILNDENFKKCGIYKITNPSNKNFYIGSAAGTFHRRFLNHRRLLFLDKNYIKITNVKFALNNDL